jgi:hypothetical protein
MENRRTESEDESTSSKVSARKTGSSGSTAWICVRTCAQGGARGGLIDDRDRRRVFKVLVDEEASMHESHAKQVKVFG